MDRKDTTKERKESTNKKILVGARFSAHFQTGPGALPASYTMRTGYLFRGLSRQGETLTTHPV
jgi:hypothetical protein